MCSAEQRKRGVLYLVPSPLGDTDLDRILPAGVRQVAARLEHWIAEGPRALRRFLKHNGTQLPLQQLKIEALAPRTRGEALERLLSPLEAGQDVGIASEAGCPGVADPGAALVRLAHRRGIRVVPLVGPSSPLLALMASGLNGQQFAFHGYLPVSPDERRSRIQALERESRAHRRTQIVMETPYRNAQLFAALLETCHELTELCVAENLTTSGERIETRPIVEWRKNPAPPGENPCLFLFLASNEAPPSGEGRRPNSARRRPPRRRNAGRAARAGLPRA